MDKAYYIVLWDKHGSFERIIAHSTDDVITYASSLNKGEFTIIKLRVDNYIWPAKPRELQRV